MEAFSEVTNHGDEAFQAKADKNVEVVKIENLSLNNQSDGSSDESDQSEGALQNCVNEDKDENETEESDLSLHVSPKDMHLFGDTVCEMGSNNQESAHKLDETESTENSDETDSQEGSHHMKEHVFLPESKLHCAVCGNLYKEPKILNCLHTFCLECLEKRKGEKHRLIICPLCKMSKMPIPKDGLVCLPSNVTAANLIALQSTKLENSSCVVCLLHGEEKKSSFHCVDCGDMLCEGCSEKHPFSRQTANHTVVSLESDGTDISHLRENQTVYCDKHQGEEVKFFCEKCSIAVCRDCILLEHGSHHCITPTEAFENRKSDILKLVDSLKEKGEEFGNEDREEDLNKLKEEEEKQIKVLETGMKMMMAIVEEKFNSSMKVLKKEFERKQIYCTTRTEYIERSRADLEGFVENIEFLLNKGKAVEIVSIEQLIKEAIGKQEVKFKSIFPKLSKSTKLPTVQVVNENIKMLEKLVFFKVIKPGKIEANTQQPPEGQTRRETSKKPVVRNVDTRTMRGVQQYPNRVQNAMSLQHQQQSQIQSLLSMNLGRSNPSFGRGQFLQEGVRSLLGDFPMQQYRNQQQNMGNQQAQFSGNTPNSYLNQQGSFGGQNNFNSFGFQGNNMVGQPHFGNARTSLLNSQDNWNRQGVNSGGQSVNRGSFPGQYNRAQQQQSAAGKKTRSVQHSDQNKNMQAFRFEKVSLSSNLSGQKKLKLKLLSSINVKVMQDQKEPEIVGLTFTSLQKFAISDARNMRVKLFSTCGKFVDMLQDPGPMSITACNNLLVWNSQFIHIKYTSDACGSYFSQTDDEWNFTGAVYDIPSGRSLSLGRKTLSGREVHPVTSFQNEKYLIGNVNKTKIEAYQIDGKHVHTMEPKDRDGDMLAGVTQIATHAKDQIVLVDNALKRIVINDFDGHFIGEYCEADWDPGCVCIDQDDNIFVTDSAANRLVLLSPRGVFLQEWKLMVDNPYCVSSNKNGSLLVAGKGQVVHMYQFE